MTEEDNLWIFIFIITILNGLQYALFDDNIFSSVYSLIPLLIGDLFYIILSFLYKKEVKE